MKNTLIILVVVFIPFFSFLQKIGTLSLSGDVDYYEYNGTEFIVYSEGIEIGKFDENGNFQITADHKLPLIIKHPDFSEIQVNFFEFSRKYPKQIVQTTLLEETKRKLLDEFNKELSANCTRPNRSEFDKTPDSIASFPGGKSEMIKYLAQNIHYPQKCLEEGIQGKVYFSFIVEEDGSVSCIQIDKGVDYFIDREAYRCVKSFPKFKPAIINGKPAACLFRFPISFKLN